MMRGGECWELSTPARLTSGSGSGLWPTPTVDDSSNATRESGSFQSLTRAVRMWPTPRQADHKGATSLSECTARRVANGQANLPEAVVESSENGGQLNPTWVEWLMGWPLFWTSLDTEVKCHYDSWHEAQQRTQTSPKDFQGGIVRNVWWDIDPSTASQGRQPNQQQYNQCDDSLPVVPCENSLLDRELGAGECKTSNLQDLRGHIQAEADTQIEAVRQAGLPKGKREEIGRIAVGVKNRVDRLRCLGNGQVPAVAALAWRTLNALIP
jgi:hypothetical protein